MTSIPVTELFNTEARFFRSIHLERDFSDGSALSGYILTPKLKQYLETLSEGFRPDSRRRAWRITGDFGAGKSAFALYLSRLLSHSEKTLPKNLRQDSFLPEGGKKARFLPVLVTGNREPIAVGLLRAVRRALHEALPDISVQISKRIDKFLEQEAPIPDSVVAEIITEATTLVVRGSKHTGVFIVIDELGKFLEYAALNPHRQDIFLLQRLAEDASRSKDVPFFVVGLLHQGFNEYASSLSISAQREWEKVAGRFEEIFFDQPLEQVVGLVAAALNVCIEAIPRSTRRAARDGMRGALDIRWYGSGVGDKALLEMAEQLYPLHPTVLPVMARIFSRFGQNQRSLFSFLISNENAALRDFSRIPVSKGEFFRLADLYDYVRSAFGHQLSFQNYRSHWNLIESTIESYSDNDWVLTQILKTVGLINLLDAPSFLPTEEAIVAALSGSSVKENDIRRLLAELREKNVLYFRGEKAGYSLLSHTSVNLETAYENAVRSVGKRPPEKVSSLIKPYLETRPVVARRHYIETGNLRHFDVRFVPVADLPTAFNVDYASSDGCLVVALCESAEEHNVALRFAAAPEREEDREVLFAVPRALNSLGKLYQETRLWEWVITNTPELNSDKFARAEATRQFHNAKQNLDKRVNALVGVQGRGLDSELRWFYQGKALKFERNRDLVDFISGVCDRVYSRAPKVHNELINRRDPSSAAIGARTRLLEGIFERSFVPYLGMDVSRKPPEMAMYLSILKAGRLHDPTGSDGLRLPVGDDPCDLLSSFEHIEKLLLQNVDSRLRISDIIHDLRRPPFGVRDGLAPILVAIYAVINEPHVALYYDGVFVTEMAGLDIKLFTKVPHNFEIQYYRVAGMRVEVFKMLQSVLKSHSPRYADKKDERRPDSKTDILDVVRPLCLFAASLPKYSLKTRRLSATASAVRRDLLGSKEPGTLLFGQLPEACGFSKITETSSAYEIEGFIHTFKDALEELRFAYSRLQERMKEVVANSFEVRNDRRLREDLALRATAVLASVTEIKLKGFLLCLEDSGLGEAAWLDALGSFVCGIPPSQWEDLEEERFAQEMNVLARRFKRVEAVAFAASKTKRHQQALRIAVTSLDGSETDDVVFFSKKEEDEVSRIENEILDILRRTRRLGRAAAARAVYKVLSQTQH